jgi:hypothetical protein
VQSNAGPRTGAAAFTFAAAALTCTLGLAAGVVDGVDLVDVDGVDVNGEVDGDGSGEELSPLDDGVALGLAGALVDGSAEVDAGAVDPVDEELLDAVASGVGSAPDGAASASAAAREATAAVKPNAAPRPRGRVTFDRTAAITSSARWRPA